MQSSAILPQDITRWKIINSPHSPAKPISLDRTSASRVVEANPGGAIAEISGQRARDRDAEDRIRRFGFPRDGTRYFAPFQLPFAARYRETSRSVPSLWSPGAMRRPCKTIFR